MKAVLTLHAGCFNFSLCAVNAHHRRSQPLPPTTSEANEKKNVGKMANWGRVSFLLRRRCLSPLFFSSSSSSPRRRRLSFSLSPMKRGRLASFSVPYRIGGGEEEEKKGVAHKGGGEGKGGKEGRHATGCGLPPKRG